MRILFTFVIAFIIQNHSFSQIKVVSEREKNNDIRFYAENEDNIPYSVFIEFTELKNLSSYEGMKVLAISNPGKTSVVKLTRKELKQLDFFKFTTSYHKGNYRAKTKEDFLYLIPLAEEGLATLRPLTHIENSINLDKTNETYVGVSFLFDTPTTICAPR